MCLTPNSPENGIFKSLPVNVYGSILIVDCEEGYFLIGENQLQCLDDDNDGEGEWVPRVPTCRCKSVFRKRKKENNR